MLPSRALTAQTRGSITSVKCFIWWLISLSSLSQTRRRRWMLKCLSHTWKFKSLSRERAGSHWIWSRGRITFLFPPKIILLDLPGSQSLLAQKLTTSSDGWFTIHLTLMMTSAQIIETSDNVTTNPEDHSLPTMVWLLDSNHLQRMVVYWFR